VYRNHFRKVVLAAGLGALSVIPALSQTGANQSSSVAPRQGRYDADIQKNVDSKLKKDKFKNVQSKVEDGVVTLTGTVNLLNDKADAENRVKDIDHVQSVANQIQVGGPTIADAQLRDKLADKLRYDRVGYGIIYNALALDVSNGIATISGKVRTEADKASALATARTTPGVKGVRDEIEVLPTSIMDDDLRIALARRLYNDPVLAKYATDPQGPIRIIVENGHVTLAGTVLNEMDRNVAAIRAKEVSGVFSVDNQLEVANRSSENARKQ